MSEKTEDLSLTGAFEEFKSVMADKIRELSKEIKSVKVSGKGVSDPELITDMLKYAREIASIIKIINDADGKGFADKKTQPGESPSSGKVPGVESMAD
jgi:tryptophan synthase alpha subunit